MASTTPPAAYYPRPDFQRPGLTWASLNGPWDFWFDDHDEGLTEGWHLSAPPPSLRRTIQVPYAFQTPASGINERAAHEVLWYRRRLHDPRTAEARARRDRVLVRFGAVDYEATVWVDGALVGGHTGGHVPFDVDVTDALSRPAHRGGGGGGGEEGRDEEREDEEGGKGAAHLLTLRVRDSPYDLTQPRGKQYWGPEPESIFYTPSSGIWQNVWLEAVPAARIGSSSEGTVLTSNDIAGGLLRASVAVVGRRARAPASVEIRARLLGVDVGSARAPLPRDQDVARLELDMRLPEGGEQLDTVAGALARDERVWRGGLALWSPEHPLLYDLTLRLYDASGSLVDEVETTTGMRSLDWQRGDGTFRLNDRPIFQVLNLDQGYWPDTFMTPPSADALRRDIELAKAMGFNGCRKHQKVEDPAFLYWADRLGYLVWGEMANAYEFSAGYAARFDAEWAAAVRRDRNHPSVVAWTPVNESWAYPHLNAAHASRAALDQRHHLRHLYHLTRALDATRPVNDNCGWEHVRTDLSTFHDYADGDALAAVCATLPGIIHRTIPDGRPMFVGPLYGAGARVLDPGAQHESGAPVICSEFGGVNIAPAARGGGEGKKFSTEDWGYTTASDPEDLLKRIEKLVLGVVQGGHCCGMVYTQL